MKFRALALTTMALAAAAPLAAAPFGLPPVLYARGPFNQPRLAGDMLVAHNAERRRVGVLPVAWDPALAAGAQEYANELARNDYMRHSPKTLRPGQGENLWMGTRDYFRPQSMVGSWTSEKSMFRPAVFPQNSRTGNWADVGHYTQMIWPGTQRIGCAIGSSARNDFLVCRYWPSGNVDGRRVP